MYLNLWPRHCVLFCWHGFCLQPLLGSLHFRTILLQFYLGDCMIVFFHILGWILLLTPFIALSVAVVLVYGRTGAIVLGSIVALTGIILLAIWLISY